MKDAGAAIRKAYVDRLSSLEVGVYDEQLPLRNTDQKYILLTSYSQDASRNKDRFESKCSLVVDINVRVVVPTGKLDCDNIANDVLVLINTLRKSGYVDLGDEFDCVLTTVLQNESLHLMTPTAHNYRRLIRFQHTVLEK